MENLKLDETLPIAKVVEKCIELKKLNLMELIVTDFNAFFETDSKKFEILKSCSLHQENFDIFNFFLKKGANIDAIDNDGWTLLMYCALLNESNCAKHLLDNKANTDIISKSGKNALIISINHHHVGITGLLLDFDVDLALKDDKNRNVLEMCEYVKTIYPLPDRWDPIIERLKPLLADSKKPGNKMRICTDGTREIAIPEDPLIKIFYDKDLKFDQNTMKKPLIKVQNMNVVKRLVDNKWIREEHEFPECNMEIPEGFKGAFHVLPAGLIIPEESIVRFVYKDCY
jgi:hypothetical protein